MEEFFTPGRILDILAVILFVWMIVVYFRKGFLAGTADFFGGLLSALGALWAANKLSGLLFHTFFESNLITRTSKVISEQGAMTVQEILKNISSFLPKNIIELFGGSLENATFDMSAPNTAERIVKEVVEPLVTPVISVLVFFAVFVLCRLVLRYVVLLLTKVNHLPLIGTANRFLGGVSGALVGALDAYILMCAVWALVIITDGSLPFLTADAVSQSWVFGVFRPLIPFIN